MNSPKQERKSINIDRIQAQQEEEAEEEKRKVEEVKKKNDVFFETRLCTV